MERSTYREPLDSPEHRLTEEYIQVTRLHRSMMEHQLEGTGVYHSQHQILIYVSRNPNVSQKGLAGVYGVSGVTIAVSLRKLEKGGYIDRLVDQDNNRYNQIRITEKGRRVVEDSISIFRRMGLSMFEGFSENDRKVLGELLDQIYESLQHISDKREDNQVERYKKYMRSYLSAFIIGPLLMLTEVFGEIILPRLMSMIINHGVADRNLPYALSIGAVMVLTIFVMAAGGIGGAYFSAKASICFIGDLRDGLFAKVQEFSFGNIDNYSTGSLITRLTNDIQQIQDVVMMGPRLILRTPGMFMGALIMAFTTNAGLAVVILVVISLLTLTIVLILRAASPRSTIMQRKLDRLNSSIQEVLTNMRVIKSFVREDFEYNKFKEMDQNLKESSLDAMKTMITTMPVMMLATNITTLAMVRYGSNIIIMEGTPVGGPTAFTTYIVQILMSFMMLSMVSLRSSRAMTSAEHVGGVMDTRIDLTNEQASRKNLVAARGWMESRHVDFSYSGNEKELVLEDISFTVEPGQTLGVIGSTGSGKTTLIQMMPRFYDATKGQVLIDGVDVREYSLRNLREGMGIVLQENVLFSDAIEENLHWGSGDTTREEIRAMARSAQVDGFITSFTHGYDTDMGQGGVNVPGGQKQRLCIARALSKRPRILILDDNTSAVDTATEAKIRECFRTTLKDITKIIIAQCVGSVEESDLILVLDDGRTIGQGSHKDLLEHYRVYQEICYSQRDRGKTQGVSAS